MASEGSSDASVAKASDTAAPPAPPAEEAAPAAPAEAAAPPLPAATGAAEGPSEETAPAAEPRPATAALCALADSLESDSDGRVLVTGASGYLGAHVAQQLQAAGFRVRGTTRSLANEAKVAPLRELCPGARHPIELVEAELTNAASWTAAVEGCAYVVHVASPFPKAKPKHEDELVRPAVDGTLNVLRACANTNGKVRRVVVTSSIASVGGHIDGYDEDEEHPTLTEENWTDVTKASPYPKSKTLAERAAWRFVDELPDAMKFELATICPGFIIGPMLTRTACTSAEVPIRLLNRDMPAVPDLHWAAVDVREVARAHLLALAKPEAAGKRFICVSGDLSMRETADLMAAHFDPLGYNIPTMPLPKWTMWVASFWDESLDMVLPQVGKRHYYSNARAREELGLTFRPTQQSFIEMATSIVLVGLVPDRSGGRIAAGIAAAAAGTGAAPTGSADGAAEGAAGGAGGGAASGTVDAAAGAAADGGEAAPAAPADA